MNILQKLPGIYYQKKHGNGNKLHKLSIENLADAFLRKIQFLVNIGVVCNSSFVFFRIKFKFLFLRITKNVREMSPIKLMT